MSTRRTVYFVCTGNTCRSPMAETLFRAELARADADCRFDAASFGLAAARGVPATPFAREAAAELGGDLSAHRSHGAADVSPSAGDIFIAMTPQHLHALKAAPVKSFLISDFFPENAFPREVPDPFGGTLDDYRRARDAIVSAFPRLLHFLQTLD